MPSLAATTLALGMLADAGMIRDLGDARQAEQRAASWGTLLDADMSDSVLGDAVRRVASGQVDTYGPIKPSDVNRAARAVRAERIRQWRQSHELPTGSRDGFAQSAYLRGFVRAIGNGLDEVEADRHGRAAKVVAGRVAEMEPATPLPEVLARMDRAMAEGRLPWTDSLPPARPVAEIGCTPSSPFDGGDGRERARAVIRELAARATEEAHMPQIATESRLERPNGGEVVPG